MATSTLHCEQLESRSVPVVYAASGSLVYELTSGGDVVRQFQPFPDAQAVPVRVAVSAGVLYVGAGEGGAPRLSAFALGGFSERWSVFVGDPNSRNGVNVTAIDSTIRVTPDTTLPPTTKQLELEQAVADRYDPKLLPPDTVVTVFNGHRIDQLPEFADLSQVPFPGNPKLVAGQAVGVSVPGRAWVAAGWGATGHELGHLRHYWLGLELTPSQMEDFADDFAFYGGK